MKKLFISLFILVVVTFGASPLFSGNTKTAKGESMSNITVLSIKDVSAALIKKAGDGQKEKIERSVKQAAALWTEADGTEKDFSDYMLENYISDEKERLEVFDKISFYFESLYGHYNKMSLDMNQILHLNKGSVKPVDMMFGSYSPSANLTEDLFKNKIAFYIVLNFPFYNLKEKQDLGQKWNRQQWAYARLGDAFTSRVPSEVLQKINETVTRSEAYISEYNIMMGYLVDSDGKTHFPKDMKLLSHWNLRDELKSQYAKPEGIKNQRTIYEVMKRIISQEIPQDVINSTKYSWNPIDNRLFLDGKEVKDFKREPDTRYQHLLNNFLSQKDADKYNPGYPTYISRKFDQEMEIPVAEVEKLFIKLCSSPTIRKVGELIKKRLGRNLEPFDIWYDGFKARSTISEDELTAKTRSKYKDVHAFKNDMPRMLQQLGFAKEDANRISSKIEVDGARGSGHAWGAQMKSENAHLRTRIGEAGMDYKGYNIAVHEFGHNVEQTITLQDVDNYMMMGVPNTAFTEAWAFVFQKRDLELLGIDEKNPDKAHLLALDNIWACYEIMGVSLVDQYVWNWLYQNPDATAADLKESVIAIAKDVWNKYFADVLGMKDSPILAIYSHMIDSPLYLSAYPIGHLIEFQTEQFIAGKNLGTEMKRMLTQGRLVPQVWMKGAVGREISVDPILSAAEEAMKKIK